MSQNPAAIRPLDGVRVVDLTSVIMGPYATQILADLGADVITIEDGNEALNRAMGDGPHPQLSGISLNLLRNKRSVVLDLKDEVQFAASLRLIGTADVFVTNLRPGALQRLGLDYQGVSAVRADIVYCQAQGWPADSAKANEPAYDDIIQAATGLPDAARLATGVPAFSPTIVADKVCGLTIAYAVMASLLRRARTGQGAHLEVPMTDVMTSFVLTEHAAGATTEPPQSSAGYARILNASRKPHRSQDGWVSVLPYSQAHYQDLFGAAGRDDLVDDPRIVDTRTRIAHASELYRLVSDIVATGTTAHWLGVCEKNRIPASAVATLDDLVAGLPLAEHPVIGPYHVIPQPVRFHEAPGETIRRPAPLPGQHTDEVLREIGLADDEIAHLKQSLDARPRP